jgi:RNA polymerase sigma factor (sigma-70 family)
LDEPSSVERLWEEFKLKASADARERLILDYAPLVKYVAGGGAGRAAVGRLGAGRPAQPGGHAGGQGRRGPVAVFEPQELKHILAGAINRLGEREKIVITLYDYEGLTLAEIGQVLGVTESPVCQMHTKAVLQLRAKMQDAR